MNIDEKIAVMEASKTKTIQVEGPYGWVEILVQLYM